jgi:hypothetical protein
MIITFDKDEAPKVTACRLTGSAAQAKTNTQ